MKGADRRGQNRQGFLTFCLTLRKIQCPTMDFPVGRGPKRTIEKLEGLPAKESLCGPQGRIKSSAQMDLGQLGQERRLH